MRTKVDCVFTDHVICACGKSFLSNGVEQVGGIEDSIVVGERVNTSAVDSDRGIFRDGMFCAHI